MKYKILKENVRQEAINWQSGFNNQSYSWGEITAWQNYFYAKARRLGLVRELRENGII